MDKLCFEDIEEMVSNFKSFNKTMHYMMIDKCGEVHVSPDQTKLLFIVLNHQNINQNTLAKKLNITKATLSVRLQRLEKLGYIIKKQDENDKRIYILEVTDLGKEFIDSTIEIMKEKTLLLFDGVSKEQIDIINKVINIMKENIEKCKGDKEC